MESIKEIIIYFSLMLQVFLEFLSVICVFVGLVKALYTTITKVKSQSILYLIRARFGTWLALALEFQLAADILATTINPSMEELVKLVIIAVIRTFLNYFLSKELDYAESNVAVVGKTDATTLEGKK
ncbi:DUF1622 domain-containing protein [Serratia fonticola]|uniref:DUF1622 domain-containing protein n=1 Tax=Serratia fonticola TaxID=47917 RepID=UPI00192B12B8|nr:DUF1622 domain-containing protein [Serratia fonticola]MBL5828002.1 DUF1622 domain-containing protein [Serratia fonticola]MBL5906242.1 DUF1622 domain-containing protein [Serratia fonticola]